MKSALIALILFMAPVCLLAQGVSIGKTQDQIRSIVQSNPAFKLAPGQSTDTLYFQATMQTVFYYKDKICDRTVSGMPLMYLYYVTSQMTKDGYTEVRSNFWISTHKTLQVQITVDKEKDHAEVVTTSYNDPASKNQ